MATPQITVTHLSGHPGQRVLVLGPSLGTRVVRLWARAAELLTDRCVIGWDLPGHGRSAPASRPFSAAELAAGVLDAVDAVVGSEQVLCCAGDSFGGSVGLQLILDRPDRFEAAAILCSGAKIATPGVWRERAELVRREGLRPVQDTSAARWFGGRILASPTAESRAVLDELLAVDATSYAFACEALAGFDVRDRLSGIRVPLLAIAGADDPVTTPEQHQELARAVLGARVRVLPGVGHLAPLEDPTATAALLERHFAKETAHEH